MKKDFWAKIDAYLFRVTGAVIGLAGCAGLILNNSPKDLFTSIYGWIFLLIFGTLGVYSSVSLLKGIFGNSSPQPNK